MIQLGNKKVIVAISGGIAAYKSVELVRTLRKAGAQVRVVMTSAATEFITPLTLQALSGNPVHQHLLDERAEAGMGHIELARWADVIVIAPATADCLAKLTQGIADQLLYAICLASDAKKIIAPAMNQQMWRDESTTTNLQKLIDRGFHVVGPASGEQACGDIGLGRMAEPDEIADVVAQQFDRGELAGKRIVITAGPTREAIDPVRYLTNRSSGKMGYAMAVAAIEAGAYVTLITGPTHIAVPERATVIRVVTADEMYDATMANMSNCDIFIATAAVCDYKPAQLAAHKIKKHEQKMFLELERNRDLLADVGKLPIKPFCMGFAAETENLITNAKEKLQRKNLDVVIANHVGDRQLGFDSDDNQITIISLEGEETIARTSKTKIAEQLIKYIAQQINKEGKKIETCAAESSE